VRYRLLAQSVCGGRESVLPYLFFSKRQYRPDMSAPAHERGKRRGAQKCGATAQPLPLVVAAVCPATDAIPPVDDHLSLCVPGPFSDMHAMLQRMECIRSRGNMPEQHQQLAALLGGVLRFSQHVCQTSVKVCVIVVTEMLALLHGDRTDCEVTRGDWAIVRNNVCSMQSVLPTLR
jgi:hypothetical protein